MHLPQLVEIYFIPPGEFIVRGDFRSTRQCCPPRPFPPIARDDLYVSEFVYGWKIALRRLRRYSPLHRVLLDIDMLLPANSSCFTLFFNQSSDISYNGVTRIDDLVTVKCGQKFILLSRSGTLLETYRVIAIPYVFFFSFSHYCTEYKFLFSLNHNNLLVWLLYVKI